MANADTSDNALSTPARNGRADKSYKSDLSSKKVNTFTLHN